jgi:hypothetical protein
MNGVQTTDIVIMKERQLMGVHGIVIMTIRGCCVVVVGTAILSFAVLPIGTTLTLTTITVILVFGLCAVFS